MEENPFLLNEDSFLVSYKPAFKGDLNFKHAVQFLITIPYHIPYQDNSIVSYREEKFVSSYNFLQVEKEKQYTAGADIKGKISNYFVTRVEMTYFTDRIYYFFSEKDLSNIFDDLLKNLNIFITAYLVKSKDLDMQKISKEMLEPLCLYRTIELDNDAFKNENKGLLFLHPNLAYKKEIISIEKQSEIAQYMNVIKGNQNPFVLSEDFMISARRNFKQGFYKETVLDAQTSIETFLRTLYKECLKIEGYTEEQIGLIQEETSYITMVKREFARRIGGSWDISNERKEVGNWYKQCYELRNKIIHAGYSPSFSEVDVALDAAIKLREFVYKRLNKSVKFKSISELL